MALTSSETNCNLVIPQISQGWHCRETQVQFYLIYECVNIYSIIDGFFLRVFSIFIPMLCTVISFRTRDRYLF